MSVVMPQELYSPEQLGLVTIELRQHLEKLQDRDVRRKVAKTSGETLPPLSILANKVLEANNLTPAAAQGISTLVDEFEALRPKAPIARLILAELPDEDMRNQLTEWFRTKIHPLSLLTFTARTDIGGGFKLQAGSKQYDFSFKTQLLNNKMHLAEIFSGGRK